ncbi:MAG: 16S rRNA (guanine(527)-N(7))-methyltransferase RsmG [Acidobacteriaceae bacterium]|jgi:16S rRNA (guanine527-N7)-methyltransferase
MSPETLTALLTPYAAVTRSLASQLVLYLDLILKWNDRVNLTAIRNPEDIVRRHFGESLFAAAHLGPCRTLLDYGSGAGFPGLPIQLAHPTLQVTLAESRARKAAFLHEAVRTLNLPTEIWPHRVESMADNRTFDAVTLRAVDHMPAAIAAAALRSTHKLLILSTLSSQHHPLIPPDFTLDPPIPLPESHGAALLIARHR